MESGPLPSGRRRWRVLPSKRMRRSKADSMLQALMAPVKISVAVACRVSREESLTGVIAVAPCRCDREPTAGSRAAARVDRQEKDRRWGVASEVGFEGGCWSWSFHTPFYAHGIKISLYPRRSGRRVPKWLRRSACPRPDASKSREIEKLKLPVKIF